MRFDLMHLNSGCSWDEAPASNDNSWTKRKTFNLFNFLLSELDPQFPVNYIELLISCSCKNLSKKYFKKIMLLKVIKYFTTHSLFIF